MINLNTSNFPFLFSFNRVKSHEPVKALHSSSELVVSNLAMKNSSIILEAYTLKILSKQIKVINPHGVQLVVCLLTTNKTWLVTFSLPEFNLKKQMSWKFHVDNCTKKVIWYDHWPRLSPEIRNSTVVLSPGMQTLLQWRVEALWILKISFRPKMSHRVCGQVF
jgi:hypothetical protein